MIAWEFVWNVNLMAEIAFLTTVNKLWCHPILWCRNQYQRMTTGISVSFKGRKQHRHVVLQEEAKFSPTLRKTSEAPSVIHDRHKWRALSCKWRWQTTSALRGDGTRREGVRGQRMKRQHLCSHLTGWKKSGRRGWLSVWERVGVALEARMEDTSLPAAAVRGKGTQGLLFPLRSLSPRRSLVFPQQTVGTMKAACSPPLAQRAVNTGPIRPWMAESVFPWKSSQWPASPGSPTCEVGDSYNFNK